MDPEIGAQWSHGPTLFKPPHEPVMFEGSTEDIDCGSDKTLDDLHDSQITVGFWYKPKRRHKMDPLTAGILGLVFLLALVWAEKVRNS